MKTTRVATIVLWVVFVVGNSALWFATEPALTVMSVGLLLLLLLTWSALLLRYARWMGQWRMVVLSWSVYGGSRLLAGQLAAAAMPAATTMVLLLTLYALVAGYGALVILSIRRDVSVAYFVLPFVVLPVLLLTQIRATGGILAALWGSAVTEGELALFSWLEPIVMAASCMVPLACVTFFGHFLGLLIKEQRRQPLMSVAMPPVAVEAEP